jgi:hypothetical protein
VPRKHHSGGCAPALSGAVVLYKALIHGRICPGAKAYWHILKYYQYFSANTCNLTILLGFNVVLVSRGLRFGNVLCSAVQGCAMRFKCDGVLRCVESDVLTAVLERVQSYTVLRWLQCRIGQCVSHARQQALAASDPS